MYNYITRYKNLKTTGESTLVIQKIISKNMRVSKKFSQQNINGTHYSIFLGGRLFFCLTL